MTLFKNCSGIFDPSKNIAPIGGGGGGGGLFPLYGHEIILKKSSPLEPLVWFWKFFHMNVPWVNLFKKCSRNFDSSKNMATMGGGDFLHYMDMKKFLKNLLLQNCWSEFGMISEDCSLCDPFQNLFAKFWTVEKNGHHGGKLFSLCGL